MAQMGNWQNTGRETKFWIFNSTTSFPVLLLMLRISWNTFFLVIATMGVFFILDYYGFKVKVFFRLIRSFLAGRRKVAKPWWV